MGLNINKGRNMDSSSLAWWFIFAVVVVVAIVCVPLALIWSVNTLFGTAITVSFKTWAAALILSAPFAYSGGRK